MEGEVGGCIERERSKGDGMRVTQQHTHSSVRWRR